VVVGVGVAGVGVGVAASSSARGSAAARCAKLITPEIASNIATTPEDTSPRSVVRRSTFLALILIESEPVLRTGSGGAWFA
jgi:hypothetical protein